MRRRIASRSPTSKRPAMAPSGTGRRASTASPSSPAATAPALRQVGLPGDPDDTHSRYIEAEVDGVIVASHLSAQRQSGRDREIRLQAALDGAARRAMPRELARRGAAGRARRRLQRHPRRPRHLLAPSDGAMTRCSSPKARRRSARSSTRAGPMRCAPSTRPRRGSTPSGTIQAGALAARRGLPHRPSAVLSPQAADRLRGAGVDKWARAEEKASDHAPTWVELA